MMKKMLSFVLLCAFVVPIQAKSDLFVPVREGYVTYYDGISGGKTGERIVIRRPAYVNPIPLGVLSTIAGGVAGWSLSKGSKRRKLRALAGAGIGAITAAALYLLHARYRSKLFITLMPDGLILHEDNNRWIAYKDIKKITDWYIPGMLIHPQVVPKMFAFTLLDGTLVKAKYPLEFNLPEDPHTLRPGPAENLSQLIQRIRRDKTATRISSRSRDLKDPYRGD